MRARPSLLVSGLAPLAVLAGCAGTSVTSTDPNPVDAWLVWSSTDGVARTEWLAADGTVRGRADGIVVATTAGLFTVASSEVAVPTLSCAAQEAAAGGPPAPADDPAVEPGTATRLALTPLAPSTGDALEIVAAGVPDADDEMTYAAYQHGVLVTAGLGRFLFVTESTSVYSCGAHGAVGVSATTVDLETGEPVDLMAGADLTASREAARKQLVQSFAADGITGDDTASTVDLGASVPTWTDGRLAMRHLFYTDACYACGDGEWSSYSRATRVDDPALPPALALTGVPPAIAHHVSALPEPRGVSWGKATDAWKTALPAPRR